MARFMDTIKDKVGKIKELWTDDSDILADDEILEEYADDVKVTKATSKIVSYENGESAGRQEKIPERQPRVETKAPAARKTAQSSSLYAHENRYTGSTSYDDTRVVTFSVAGNTSFGTRHENETTIAARSSETFGDKNISAEITPVKPAATYTTAAAPAARTTSEPVRGYTFSSVNEPATFASRPSTSLDSTAPATSRASAIVNEEPEIVRAKAPVGFNTSGAVSSSTQNYNNPARTNIGGRGMEKMTVQILKPTDISEASEASNLLKNGIIVIAELSGIADKNARVRYSDFLCGCCKGCDADFREIVPVDAANSVLIAVPTGSSLKMPVEKVRETATATTQPAPAKVNDQVDSLFSNLDISNSQNFRRYGNY